MERIIVFIGLLISCLLALSYLFSFSNFNSYLEYNNIYRKIRFLNRINELNGYSINIIDSWSENVTLVLDLGSIQFNFSLPISYFVLEGHSIPEKPESALNSQLATLVIDKNSSYVRTFIKIELNRGKPSILTITALAISKKSFRKGFYVEVTGLRRLFLAVSGNHLILKTQHDDYMEFLNLSSILIIINVYEVFIYEF